MTAKLAPLTATFTGPDGSPDKGEVYVRADISAPNTSPARIVTDRPVWVALDEMGAVEFNLTPSDDPDWGTSEGIAYVVHERLRIAGDRAYRVWLPEGGGDLSDLRPLEDAPGYTLLGAGIPEAPLDGEQYGRQDGTWTPVESGGPHDHEHGALTALGADDHPHYLTTARHGAEPHAGLPYADPVHVHDYAPTDHPHSEYLPLAGGTMGGVLNLADSPLEPLEAATKKYVDDTRFLSGVSISTFEYRLEIGGAIDQGKVGTDNADPALVTKVIAHKLDRDNYDRTEYFNQMAAGDWVNLHQRDDSGNVWRFDVTGPPVAAGDTWEIPVTPYDQSGADLTDGDRVLFVWRASAAEHDHDGLYDPTGTAQGLMDTHTATVGKDFHAYGWTGTQAEFDGLGAHEATRVYYVVG